MPNWCQNTLSLYNEDKSKIDQLEFECKKKEPKIFEYLYPMPKDIDDWYSWNVDNWGTKWDASIIDCERMDENTLTIIMDTAWAPPTRLYEYLEEHGWGVDAHYLEEGMGFVGRYFTGEDEEYEIDYTLPTKEEFLKSIPQEIVDHWGLDTQYDDYQAEGENNEPSLH